MNLLKLLLGLDSHLTKTIYFIHNQGNWGNNIDMTPRWRFTGEVKEGKHVTVGE